MYARGFSGSRQGTYCSQPGSVRDARAASGMSSAARSSFPAATVIRTTRTYDTGFSSRCRLRGGDGVGDRAEAVDLDRDLVARLQPDLWVAKRADPGGRARDDQVAGLERDCL